MMRLAIEMSGKATFQYLREYARSSQSIIPWFTTLSGAIALWKVVLS